VLKNKATPTRTTTIRTSRRITTAGIRTIRCGLFRDGRVDLTNADYGGVDPVRAAYPTDQGIQLTREVTEEYALTLEGPSKPALRKPTISMTRRCAMPAPMNRPIAASISAGTVSP
jgi:hypothetical protein